MSVSGELDIATAGTEVNQSDSSTNGPQGSQNLVIGKSGGQANLFGNIPGKNYGIDVSVSLATRINSILRSQDPDYVPLIANKAWPAVLRRNALGAAFTRALLLDDAEALKRLDRDVRATWPELASEIDAMGKEVLTGR